MAIAIEKIKHLEVFTNYEGPDPSTLPKSYAQKVMNAANYISSNPRTILVVTELGETNNNNPLSHTSRRTLYALDRQGRIQQIYTRVGAKSFQATVMGPFDAQTSRKVGRAFGFSKNRSQSIFLERAIGQFRVIDTYQVKK